MQSHGQSHLTTSPPFILFLAIISKAPALTVLITLISLALTQWEHSFTTGVMAVLGALGACGAAGKAGLHTKIGDALKKVKECVEWMVKAKESWSFRVMGLGGRA